MSFEFASWCGNAGLKESTIEILKENDLDNEGALSLLTPNDVATGQAKLLTKAVDSLRSGPIPAKAKEKAAENENKAPVTTKSLAKDSGLQQLLKKIEGVGSLDDPLFTLGAAETTIKSVKID